MNRGFTITTGGAGILTSLLAGEQLEITKVMVGKGKLAEDQEPADLTDLISPVALATSNAPTVSGQQVDMVVEYRNDLNGGLTEAFYLNEFGVWGKKKGDDAEAVMIYYATLGDYPQWVGPIAGGLDVRRYPVAIGLATKDVGVSLNYPAGAFVTAEEFEAALLNKANVEWVKGLTQLPGVVGGSIAETIAGHVANGIKCGNFSAMSCTDIPDGSTSWGFNVSFFQGEHTVVIAKRSYSPAMWYAELDSNGWVPEGWIRLATSTPPQEYALPLAAGWLESTISTYYRNQFNEVTINFKVFLSSGISNGLAAGLHTIAILPAGYRPSNPIYFVCAAADWVGTFFVGWVLDNGTVNVCVPTAIPPKALIGFAGSASFAAH